VVKKERKKVKKNSKKLGKIFLRILLTQMMLKTKMTKNQKGKNLPKIIK
jgi:hypothetical protein